jgi:hypothetical protein
MSSAVGEQERGAAVPHEWVRWETPTQLVTVRLRSSCISWDVRPTEMLLAPRCRITNPHTNQPAA